MHCTFPCSVSVTRLLSMVPIDFLLHVLHDLMLRSGNIASVNMQRGHICPLPQMLFNPVELSTNSDLQAAQTSVGKLPFIASACDAALGLS